MLKVIRNQLKNWMQKCIPEMVQKRQKMTPKMVKNRSKIDRKSMLEKQVKKVDF